MPADDLTGPVVMSWGWTALGVVAVLAVVAWFVVVLLRTRRVPAPPPPPPVYEARQGDPYASVRPVYLARVDAIERRFHAGELDVRGLHLELSAAVRDFATVRRGVDASVLTLSELRRVDGARRLAGLIETYYRPSFARFGAVGASTETAANGARQVIRQW